MGLMTADEVLERVRKAQGLPSESIAKTISTATGLVAFDLQAPAKNIYPVNTPFRNMIPRVPGSGGLATNWRVVQAIIGSGFDAMGWVPEGQRSGLMSYNTATKAASYVTLGEEDKVTYEARNAARTFEDVQATMAMRLLQKMMLKEEMAILGGNQSLSLGTAPTPSTSAAGSGATLPTLTYDVAVVALTLEGLKSLSGLALTQSKTITGADGQTYTLNGGCSQKSVVATQAVTLGQSLSASCAIVRGAVAYAWFVGAAGASRIEKITTINSAIFSAPLIGTGTTYASLASTDNSANANLACDGLLTTVFNPANGAYYVALATGTPGTGTPLTSSGRGSIVEIDTMLQALWDNAQISPTVIFCNSQEIRNITNKVLTSSSAPLLQYFNSAEDGVRTIAAGGGIKYYYNPFTMTPDGEKIPVRIHPNVPSGTIIAWCNNLPMQYQSNNVPNCVEIHTRQDYYQINWPIVTRAQGVGVYSEEVVAFYAPFAMAVITNIGNG